MTREEVRAAFEELERVPLKRSPPVTVEEDGDDVVLFDRLGVPVMRMAKETWAELGLLGSSEVERLDRYRLLADD